MYLSAWNDGSLPAGWRNTNHLHLDGEKSSMCVCVFASNSRKPYTYVRSVDDLNICVHLMPYFLERGRNDWSNSKSLRIKSEVTSWLLHFLTCWGFLPCCQVDKTVEVWLNRILFFYRLPKLSTTIIEPAMRWANNRAGILWKSRPRYLKRCVHTAVWNSLTG